MSEAQQPYLVLARKYRPQTLADLRGQEGLVTTLQNAFKAGKIHHAYVLTGIRGTGKTTTARIVAKALNCENGPSTTWDTDDAQVLAIEKGNHGDVLEFDAASHTSVDDIKELFEGVAYAPAFGRYKVYIIDEVHMLSKQAFNALLKTLEEPPPNVVFIFATTEVNKIPVTVLSRCMRFDLRRIPVTTLAELYAEILTKENIEFDTNAIQLIARAADGSARDGLSLLDQAIALGGGAKITTEAVGKMIGLADHAQVLELAENLLAGKAQETLANFDALYKMGQDPQLLVRSLLELMHLLTRLKLVPALADAPELTELEKTRAVPLAKTVDLAALSRVYQALLTAAHEAKTADRPQDAVAMALVRITHLANLPPVAELLAGEKIESDQTEKKKSVTPEVQPEPAAEVVPTPAPIEAKVEVAEAPVSAPSPTPVPTPTPVSEPAPQTVDSSYPPTWEALIQQMEKVDTALAAGLSQQALCLSYAPPNVSIKVQAGLFDPRELQQKLRDLLRRSKNDWQLNFVGVSSQADAPDGETLNQQKSREHAELLDKAKASPEFQHLSELFPGAELVDVKPLN